MSDAAIRLASLDGTWETCGVDRLRGIVPEGLSMSANDWGSDRASFTLKRSPGAVWPDLSAFTPVDIEIDGALVWSGRVSETPTHDGRESSVSVECEGWQYHLDDDVYQRSYVYTKLADWKDARDYVTTDLATYVTGYSTRTDGAIIIEVPSANTVAAATRGGVVLDTGDSQGVKRIVVTYTSGGHASFALEARQGDTPTAGTETNTLDAAPILTASTTASFTFTTARRYVELCLSNTSGVAVTGAATSYVRIEAVQVFRQTAYEAGNASILTADVVVKDARDAATALLSTSNDKVEAQTFAIPEMYLDGQRTPREVIQAVNAYEDCQAGVDVFRRIVFRDRPTAPLFEAGEWAGVEFEDASANSGEEIYNHVIAEGTGPDGQKLSVDRFTSQTFTTQTLPSTAALSNPSFTVDISGWSGLNTGSWNTGVQVRDTATFDSTPASMRFPAGAISALFGVKTVAYATGLNPGASYVLRVRIRRDANAVSSLVAYVAPDNDPLGLLSGNYYGRGSAAPAADTWTTIDVPVVSPIANPAVFIYGQDAGGGVRGLIWIDTLEWFESRPTLVDRRRFRRTKILPVAAAGTTASYSQMGDLFLSGHRTTPLKGGVSATGRAVRRVLGGEGVHPAKLLTQTGEMIRLAHRIDPNTGGHGRDARIASVSYNHDDNAAAIELDNRRSNFEALLERLAIVTGQL